MTRGILATCYFDLKGSAGELEEAYREFYSGQPFTRIVDKTPTTKLAAHSNLCLVNVGAQGKKAVVTAALDNLTSASDTMERIATHGEMVSESVSKRE